MTEPIPFKDLGSHLKRLRELQRESIAEVSGAVEIDVPELERFEDGHARPSEDILMLLINHFGMQDHEAVQLWESAGYENESNDRFKPAENANAKSVMVFLALDTRTIYSDSLDINVSDNGVVLNFMQENATGQSVPVSRIGMSQKQAELTIRALERAMLKSKYLQGPRLLPPPRNPTE
jgi:predicted transcriptional regulator